MHRKQPVEETPHHHREIDREDRDARVEEIDGLRGVGEVENADQPEQPVEALLGARGGAAVLATALVVPPVRSLEAGHGSARPPCPELSVRRQVSARVKRTCARFDRPGTRCYCAGYSNREEAPWRY